MKKTKWVLRDKSLIVPNNIEASITNIIESASKRKLPELLAYSVNPDECWVNGMDEAALLIKQYSKIAIIADYDADGITSAAQLFVWLNHMGKDVNVIIPKRFSEGYGAKPEQVEALPTTTELLIFVDNGIVAYEAVETAKRLGMKTLILDHHLGGDTLPVADVIIDPSAIEGSAKSPYYCGAGLSLKLIETLCASGQTGNHEEASSILHFCRVLAGIGTIADAVPLLDDNRRIVEMAGISVFKIPNGVLKELLSLMNLPSMSNPPHPLAGLFVEDIAFRIGPVLNASGRLDDSGAETVFKSIITFGDDVALNSEIAQTLIDKNEERKALVAEWQPRIHSAVGNNDSAPICVYLSGLPQGLVGIFAGRLADEYATPTIVFTDGKNGLLHGSARSANGVDLKAELDKVADVFVKYGGHAGAAGITVEASRYDEMVRLLKDSMKSLPSEVVKYYDMELNTEEELRQAWTIFRQVRLFGTNCPKPVFKVNTKAIGRIFGKEMTHIDFDIGRIKAKGWHMAEQWKDLKTTYTSLFGRLDQSAYVDPMLEKWVYKIQFSIEDMDGWKEATAKAESPLALLLKNAATTKTK